MRTLALFFALLIAVPACEPGSVAPSLGEVFGAVDARRALDCAHLAKSDPKAAAKCLGVSLLTDGLRLALDKAADLAERAESVEGPNGADDMTQGERNKLARELADSLDALAIEIANAPAAE